MDKKEAEQEASRKAKEAQNSAGKNVGMSGRDLVGGHMLFFLCSCSTTIPPHSSNITPNGSKMKTMGTARTTGIWISSDGRKKRRIWLQKGRGLQIWRRMIQVSNRVCQP